VIVGLEDGKNHKKGRGLLKLGRQEKGTKRKGHDTNEKRNRSATRVKVPKGEKLRIFRKE